MPGPKVKPTIATAGDISYLSESRQRAVQRLRSAVDEQWRVYWAQLREYERLVGRKSDREAALEWIAQHGGTVPHALIRTHPDHGGTAADLQRTLWARDVLRR